MRDMGMVTNDEPAERLFTQGMIIKNGAKMSKSLGNVVSPDEMVARYGADSTRMYTLFATAPDRELDWQDDGVEGIRRFLSKLYRVVAEKTEPTARPTNLPCEDGRGLAARTLQRKLHQTIKRISHDFEGRWHFNTSIAALMELNKLLSGMGQDISAGNIPPEDLAEVKRDLVLLLAPFAPYLAHELWETLGERESLLKAPWPKYDPALAKEDEVEIPVQVNGKLRSVVVVPAGSSEEIIRDAALSDAKIKAAIAGKQIVKKIVVPGKLVNIVVR
jgi:leucyl-tRNA synthetase